MYSYRLLLSLWFFFMTEKIYFKTEGNSYQNGIITNNYTKAFNGTFNIYLLFKY